MAQTNASAPNISAEHAYPPQQTGYPSQQNYAYPGAPPTYPQSTNPGVAPPVVVTTAPQTLTIARVAEPIKDYTAFALSVTLLCCLPFGIVGMIKASESKKKLSRGDVDGAREASKSAYGWSVAGLVCGIILTAVLVGIYYGVTANLY